MFKRIIPLLALAVLLAGCSAIDAHTEAERLSAQARHDEARAQLVAAQAMSQTLTIQAEQTRRLTDKVVRQSETTRLIALTLAGALFCLIVGGVAVVAMALREIRVTRYYLTPARPAALADPGEWPEVRAKRRALIEALQERER